MSETPKPTASVRPLWWVAGGVLLGTAVLLLLTYYGRDGVRVAGVCQMGMLAIAAIVAAWYADETRRLASQTTRLADEAFEQRKLMVQPTVRLESWAHSRDTGKRVPLHGWLYVTNDGPAPAKEVTIQYLVGAEQHCVKLAGILDPRTSSRQHNVGTNCREAVLTYHTILDEPVARRWHCAVPDRWRWNPGPSPQDEA